MIKFSYFIAIFLLITSSTLFSMEKGRKSNEELKNRIRTFPVTDKETLQKNYLAGSQTPLSDEQAQGLMPEQRRNIETNNYEKLKRDYDRMMLQRTLQSTCCCTMVGLVFIGGYLVTHFFNYMYQ